MGTVLLFIFAYVGLSMVFAAMDNCSIFSIIQDIRQEENIQHILILKNSNESFHKDFGDNFVKELCLTTYIPVIILSESASFFLKRKFSSNIITIVYSTIESDTLILQRMVENLRKMTTSKIMFLLNHTSEEKDVLKGLFDICWKNSIINTLAVFRDFCQTRTVYRYTNFPQFEIEEIQTDKARLSDRYYPNRMRDLKGHSIRIIYGGAEPKLIYSTKKDSELPIGGYVPKLFMSLAKKHNATLHAPRISKLISAQELLHLVSNKSADVLAAVTIPEYPMDAFTYPYEYINWCLMLPIEPNIPTHEIFYIVFQVQTLFISFGLGLLLSTVLELTKWRSGRKINPLAFILNDNCLRGVLGQSFTEIRNASMKIRFIYLQICLLGIILTTSYNSYLQTYVTSPPSQPKIRSFDDLLASGKKVLCIEDEHKMLTQRDRRFNEKYLKMFIFEKNFAKYLQVRDTFSTKYAYTVNSPKWVIFNEQQKYFTKPLFRQPKEMCFFEMIPMVFPINVNSIYTDILNFLILETQSSGLLEYWYRKSFNELIEAGRLKLVDLTSKPVFEPMDIDDLKMIGIGLGGAWLLATLCFVIEIRIFKWNKHSLI